MVGFAIAMGVGFAVGAVRGILANEDYYDEWESAREEAAIAWEQAQEKAEADMQRAREELESAIGVLGEHQRTVGTKELPDWARDTLPEKIVELLERKDTYGEGEYEYDYATYDDWYDATREEYDRLVDEEGLEESWTDYLHDQQMDELGEYGIRRAELEITVDLARRQFDIAEDYLDTSRRFVDREYGQQAAEAMRKGASEQAFAGASGMRSGTAHETAQEYQVARMEGLNLWREKSLYQIDKSRKELGLQREEIDLMEQTGLAELDQFLTGARSGYESTIDDIQRGLGDYREMLDFELDRFSHEQANRTSWGAFFGGFQQGASMSIQIGDTSGYW